MVSILTEIKVVFWIIAALAGGLSAVIGNVLAINIVYFFSRKGRQPTRRPLRVWLAFFSSLTISVVFGAIAAFAPQTSDFPNVSPPETSSALSEKEQAANLYAEAQNWDIILFDTFSNSDIKWSEGESTSSFVDVYQSVSSGKYNWRVRANGYGGLRLTVAPAVASDTIYVAVDGRIVNYTNAAAFGLAFRCQGGNQDQYYHIRVYAERNAVAIKYRDKITDNWETLAYLPNIKSNTDDWNRIALIAKGSDYWLYLNGEFIYHLRDDRLKGGTVGLIAGVENQGEEASFEFDNFEYRSAP